MKKRILSLLLVLVMLMGMLPMSAMATEGDTGTVTVKVSGQSRGTFIGEPIVELEVSSNAYETYYANTSSQIEEFYMQFVLVLYII